MAKIAKHGVWVAVVGLAGVAIWLLVSVRAEQGRVSEAQDTTMPLVTSWTDEPNSGARAISQQPARVAMAVKTSDDGWDDLSSFERTRILETQLEKSLADAAGGDRSAVQRASDALTALRAELYLTPEGRVRHASYEARLEDAIGALEGKEPQ